VRGEMMKRIQPLPISLAVIIALLLFSNWHTAKVLNEKIEFQRKALDQTQWLMINSFFKCQPSVYLNSTNPVDAIALMRYRDATNGRGCVFLSDGRYGQLWWSMIIEKQDKAHLEWNFQELGHYKW
jgi:hypothetical protein